jgi:hypothetical protein
MPSPMSERSISRLTSQADVIICLLVRWMITSSGSKRGGLNALPYEGEVYFAADLTPFCPPLHKMERGIEGERYFPSQADVIICLLVRWMITSSGSKRGIEGERYFPSLIGAGIQLAPK